MDSYIPRRPREERSHRSKSPARHTHKRRRSNSPRKVALPSRATPLHKDDFLEYRSLFALYLDVQKSIVLDELSDHEARGRWKSFLKKWYVLVRIRNFQTDLELQDRRLTLMRNHGDLSEGWYDPATKKKAGTFTSSEHSNIPDLPSTRRRSSPDYGTKSHAAPADEESDEDEFGPALPSKQSIGPLATSTTTLDRKVGPAIPNLQDLEYRDGM
jgi:hypothetical protein